MGAGVSTSVRPAVGKTLPPEPPSFNPGSKTSSFHVESFQVFIKFPTNEAVTCLFVVWYVYLLFCSSGLPAFGSSHRPWIHCCFKWIPPSLQQTCYLLNPVWHYVFITTKNLPHTCETGGCWAAGTLALIPHNSSDPSPSHSGGPCSRPECFSESNWIYAWSKWVSVTWNFSPRPIIVWRLRKCGVFVRMFGGFVLTERALMISFHDVIRPSPRLSRLLITVHLLLKNFHQLVTPLNYI